MGLFLQETQLHKQIMCKVYKCGLRVKAEIRQAVKMGRARQFPVVGETGSAVGPRLDGAAHTGRLLLSRRPGHRAPSLPHPIYLLLLKSMLPAEETPDLESDGIWFYLLCDFEQIPSFLLTVVSSFIK